jgi:hypothetical protein
MRFSLSGAAAGPRSDESGLVSDDYGMLCNIPKQPWG